MKIGNLTAALCAAMTTIVPTTAHNTKNISTAPNNNTVCNEAVDSAEQEHNVSYSSTANNTFKTYSTFMEAYFEGLYKNFGDNDKGSCGYIALSMILTYFDTFLNDNIVPEKYDVPSYGDYKNMIVRDDSPGAQRDSIYNHTNLTATEYYNEIEMLENYSLQAKLICIGNYPHHIYNFNDNKYPCGTFLSDRVRVLQTFLETESKLNRNQYGITYRDETYSSDSIKQYIINEINKGYPVLAAIENSKGSHACVAYAYDNTTDEIIFHSGWHGYSTRQTMSQMGYSTYKSAMTFFPHVEHVHSNNYAVKRQDNPNEYDYYCSCSDKIITYKHDACDFTDSETVTADGHTGYCICGKSQTAPHTYDSSYKNTRNEKTHTAYCSCGRSKTESHLWKPFSSTLFPAGEYVQCRYCSFIKKAGNDDRIPIERPLKDINDGLYSNAIISI